MVNPSYQRVIPKKYIPNGGGQAGADQYFSMSSPVSPVSSQYSNTITPPNQIYESYMLTVYNPSTEFDVVVKVFNTTTPFPATGQKDSLIKTVTITKSSALTGTTVNCYDTPVYGAFSGNRSVKLIMSNQSTGVTTVTPVARMYSYGGT